MLSMHRILGITEKCNWIFYVQLHLLVKKGEKNMQNVKKIDILPDLLLEQVE